MNDRLTILCGDALEKLRELPDESVQCCVTSPPFWGLRDYGTAKWGPCKHCQDFFARFSCGLSVYLECDCPKCQGYCECLTCDHKDPKANKVFGNPEFNENRPSRELTQTVSYRDECGKCGAKRIDAQLGLEKTPGEYVAKIVAVFREVRRVLRKDGTLWLNLGDSYAQQRGGRSEGSHDGAVGRGDAPNNGSVSPPPGLKAKDLVGIPWMVAFALRADGWWLRSDIIWAKPNPMPESVTDRPTKSHEYIFLLTKSAKYFYDAGAIAETLDRPDEGLRTTPARFGGALKWEEAQKQSRLHSGNEYLGTSNGMRNKRSVWRVATQPYPEAHFATYPPDLIKPCILAGSKVGDVVLDPFAGSGTTGLVSLELGRRAILIELNPKYVMLIEQRTDVTPGLALA